MNVKMATVLLQMCVAVLPDTNSLRMCAKHIVNKDANMENVWHLILVFVNPVMKLTTLENVRKLATPNA